MSLGLEVRYLDIRWKSECRVQSLRVSDSALKLERSKENILSVETAIFNDFYPLVGLCVDPEVNPDNPVILSANGENLPLLRIKDPVTGTWWWIQNNGWDNHRRRHYSELQRTSGLYRVLVGDKTLHINNRLSGLREADIQTYVDDFKGSLLWMILNDDSAAVAKGVGQDTGEGLAYFLESFYTALHRILSVPAVKVHEIQAYRRVPMVRPIAATFRQYSKNPAAPQLISRVFEESLDTVENRYIRYISSVVMRFSLAFLSSGRRQANFLDELAVQETVRAEKNLNITYRKVSPEIFDRQTHVGLEKLEVLSKKVDEKSCFFCDGAKRGVFAIEISNKYFLKYSFFYKRLEPPNKGLDDVA